MLISLAVVGTNIVVAYATYMFAIKIVLNGVRITLHHMGGQEMEDRFLAHANQVIDETQAKIDAGRS